MIFDDFEFAAPPSKGRRGLGDELQSLALDAALRRVQLPGDHLQAQEAVVGRQGGRSVTHATLRCCRTNPMNL